jgi:hypothetical protein
VRGNETLREGQPLMISAGLDTAESGAQ